jgi:hypothetical protein
MTTFVLLLGTGSALIALWIVARFPGFGPSDITKALLHVAFSAVVLQMIVPGIHAVAVFGQPAAKFIGAFGIVFPGLTYVFVAAAWLIRATGEQLQGRF